MFNEKALLTNNGKRGEDSRVDEILDTPEGPLATLFKKASALNKSKLKKGYIEASLLCESDFEKVSQILEIDIEIIKVYSEFYFDLTDVDRLSKIEHIEKLRDRDEALLKMWALSHGLEFIKWRLGHKVSISPVEGLVDLFSTCIYKSKEAMFNTSTSDTSKESTKWAKLSTDIGRLLKLWVMDSSAAKKDLEIAIKEVVPEFEGLDSLLEENGSLAGLALDDLRNEETNT